MNRSFPIIVSVFLIIGERGVFAQGIEIGGGELTLNGRIVSGVSFDINSTTNKDGTFKMLNMAYPDNPYENSLRADLYTAYTRGNGGFKFALRADDVINGLNGGSASTSSGGPGGSTGGYFSVPYAFGWIDLLNNKLRVTGGKIEDNVWGTLGLVNAAITATGARLELKPVDGLSAGVFLVVPGGESTSAGTQYATPEQTFSETIIGARYHSRSFWASALLQLDSGFDAISPASDPTFDPVTSIGTFRDDKEMRALFGVGLTFIPNFTLLAEADIWGLGDISNQGRIDLRQTAAYILTGQLRIDFRAQELLWPFSDDLKPWLEFKPILTYRVNPVVSAVLETGFGLGHYGEVDLNPAELGSVPRGNAKIYNVYVKPTALLVLGGGLAVKTWYKFTASEKKDEDFATAHQIALECGWSF
jgi:hypothetical protein